MSRNTVSPPLMPPHVVAEPAWLPEVRLLRYGLPTGVADEVPMRTYGIIQRE